VVEAAEPAPNPRRSRTLERWLHGLIHIFQDPKRRPPNRTYSNLDDLSVPTQLFALVLDDGTTTKYCVLIVIHSSQLPNAEVKSAVFSSLRELADFAEHADEYFQTGALPLEQHPGLQVSFPTLNIALTACIRLAELAASRGRIARGSFSHPTKSMISTVPPGAFWSTLYAFPLPAQLDVLRGLGDEVRRRRHKSRRSQAPAPPSSEFGGYAAAPEPKLWFASLPLASPRDRVLQPNRRIKVVHEPVATGNVNNHDVVVYGSGLVLARTHDRSDALLTLNTLFAAFSILGIRAMEEVSDFELIEVTKLNTATTVPAGFSHVMTPRNELMTSLPAADPLGIRLLVLPEEAIDQAFDVAKKLSQDLKTRALALRLLSALTLHSREHYTESFITAWKMIETSVGRDFESFWLTLGRSKRRIHETERDWTANLQIELLRAGGVLSASLCDELHMLRKHRNDIVHKLVESDATMAGNCIQHAASMSRLPFPARPLSPQVFLI
jgi:hypothetical protein